jgi:hypothetical protein
MRRAIVEKSVTFKYLTRFTLVILLSVFGGLLTYGGINARSSYQDATPTTVSTGETGTMTVSLLPPCPSTDANGNAATVIMATNVPTLEATGTDSAASTDPAGNGNNGTPNAGNGGTTPGLGYLGIRVEPVESCGLRVAEVMLDNSALIGQLQSGDVIVAIDGQPLAALATDLLASGMLPAPTASEPTSIATVQIEGTGPVPIATGGTPAGTQEVSDGTGSGDSSGLSAAFYNSLNSRRSGDTVILTVQREGQQFDILITLGETPQGMAEGIATTSPSATAAP